MSLDRPNPTSGMRHVALYASDFEATRTFYTDILHLNVDWEPDTDNVYLSSGSDNLALHRATGEISTDGQRLDHIGFILKTPEDVDAWFDYMAEGDVEIVARPKTHRDGARSFYCKDPSGTMIQMIYHPNLT